MTEATAPNAAASTDGLTVSDAGKAAADAAYLAAKASALGGGQPDAAKPDAGTEGQEAAQAEDGIDTATHKEPPPAEGEGEQQPGLKEVTLDGVTDVEDTPLEATTDDQGVVTYEATGDASMDVAMAFIGKMGIGPDHPALLAAGQGSYGLLEATLAAMGDKAVGWQQMVALGKESIERATKEAQETSQALTKATVEAAGSEAHMNTVLQWAAGVASPKEKASFNRALAADPFQAGAAMRELVRLHAAASGTTIKPKGVTAGEPGNYSAAAEGPLSKRDYAAQVDALARKHGGGNLQNLPEYQALNRRYAGQR